MSPDMKVDSHANPFAPMYCSECRNRKMDRVVFGNAVVWACAHNVIRRPLAREELRLLKESVA